MAGSAKVVAFAVLGRRSLGNSDAFITLGAMLATPLPPVETPVHSETRDRATALQSLQSQSWNCFGPIWALALAISLN